jgi:hypothetical protein
MSSFRTNNEDANEYFSPNLEAYGIYSVLGHGSFGKEIRLTIISAQADQIRDA